MPLRTNSSVFSASIPAYGIAGDTVRSVDSDFCTGTRRENLNIFHERVLRVVFSDFMEYGTINTSRYS